jgi:hydrogenase 3 maturation protease
MTLKRPSPLESEPWPARLLRDVQAADKISVLGAGNGLRADDGAGLEVADALAGRLSLTPALAGRVQVLKTFEIPENFTGAVRSFGPALVVLVDAAIGGNRPGTIFRVDPSSIGAEDISTHRIPLSALVRYLEEDIGCRVLVLGIEPRSLEWGAPLSGAVRRAVRSLVRTLCRALQEKR